MSAPPFMPFYVGDYLADTTHLTVTEHGAYMLLLMSMWRNGGSLPNDDKSLARHARCTRGQWDRMRATVLRYFNADDESLTSKHLDRWLEAKRKAEGRAPLPLAVRTFVFERDGYACVYCQAYTGPFEVDHIHPVARGGDDSLENLCCACKTCNRSKGAKLLSEWVSA